MGGGGCDSQPWRQPGAGDCNCLPSSRAASACSGAGTLHVPWLALFGTLVDLALCWQFTALAPSVSIFAETAAFASFGNLFVSLIDLFLQLVRYIVA